MDSSVSTLKAFLFFLNLPPTVSMGERTGHQGFSKLGFLNSLDTLSTYGIQVLFC